MLWNMLYESTAFSRWASFAGMIGFPKVLVMLVFAQKYEWVSKVFGLTFSI